MHNFTFTGAATALVTPFAQDGAVDFNCLKKLIEFQIRNGIDAIVVCGSTGESPTLTSKEKIAIIEKSVEFANNRVPIIVGTGTNDTQNTIAMTEISKQHGASAALVVAPYYNKPPQDCLFEHFRAIALETEFPIILYNIPGRTGVNIEVETQLRIAEECKNVIGVKEASGNLEQFMRIIAGAPEGFKVYSGDDSLALPAIACGAKGVISTISNYAPKEFGDMARLAINGEFAKAKELHYKLLELMNLNFVVTNPIPVKAIMSKIHLCENTLRMPLLPLDEENDVITEFAEALKKAGIKGDLAPKPQQNRRPHNNKKKTAPKKK